MGHRPETYLEAAAAVSAGGWASLDFFHAGLADAICKTVDGMVAAGVQVLPAPADVFNALTLTPPDKVRAVILGQDPYPTPGHAHGLAFSMAATGHRLPMSLRTIFAALQNDTGLRPPCHGNLTAWARHGILLLNTVLTVEAGKAHSHKSLGWQALAGEVLERLGAGADPVVFMLWGNEAQKAGKRLDRQRHCVIETAHPSPLAHGGGPQHRFIAARPFRQANEWLVARGMQPLDWSLPD